MALFSALVHALKRHRALPHLEAIKARVAFFRPFDWFVVSSLAVVMVLSVATMLAGVSLALTTKVPANGGSYSEGVVGSPRFINPLLAISETDQDLTKLVFSGLLKRNPDGSVVPDLASGYEISEDRTTYTVTLKEEARFQDGTPVTADDVVFTVRAAQNPEIKSPRRADWEGVLVETSDPYTITFTLSEPYAPFLQNLTLGILPKHLWGEVTPEEFPFTTLNAKPIGSGPYKVEGVRESNSGIPVEYRLKAWGGVRTPYIESFVMRFYSNEDALQSAFTRNEIDAVHSVNPRTIPGDHKAYEGVFGRIFGVFFNQNQNALFADSVVREALDVAVDKKNIVDTVLGGYGSVIDGPLPPETTSSPSLGEEDGAARARQLLADNGWEAGQDGILEKTSTKGGKKETKRLSFSLSTSNAPELKQAAEATAEGWRAIGAEVDLKFFEQNDLTVEVIRPRKYDALLFGEVVGREPDLFAFWHSSQRNDPGLNIALYANTDTDAKLSDARTEIDQSLRKKHTKEAADEIREEVAAVFLYAPHFVYVAPTSVSGVIFGTVAVPSDRFDAVDQWYLKTEQVWPLFSNQ